MRITTKAEREKFGLPDHMFLYTIEQLCALLLVDEQKLRDKVLWFDGRNMGRQPRDKIKAIDITPIEAGREPEWRIEEDEFVRWARAKGFRKYERGWAT